MLDINPFPTEFFQVILDNIVKSAWAIFSPAVLSVIIPFIIKLGVIGSVAFAIYWFGFKGFERLNSWNIVDWDFLDKYVPKKKEKIKYEKGIRGKELTEAEKTRPKIAKFVDSM